jgi:hypothetical protein
MSRVKARVENGLDTLEADGIIGAWQYCEEEPSEATSWEEPLRGASFEARQEMWLNGLVWIEPPNSITQPYRDMFRTYREKRGRNDPLSEAVEERRIEQQLSRLRICESLKISPSEMMLVEQGGPVSQRTRKAVTSWLGLSEQTGRVG